MIKTFIKAGVFLCTASLGFAAEADSMINAIKSGKPTVNLRLRYESVDHDAAARQFDSGKHEGLIMRTAIGYKTGSYKGFSSTVELEDISTVHQGDYARTGNGILDPESADINQGYIKYSNGSFTGLLGRQTIIYDNARHIGNVGWRQNDQTYDALTLKYKAPSLPLSLSYNYAWQVNRIVATEEKMDTHLFNANYKGKYITPSLYYYKVGFEPDLVGFFTPANDSDTFGLRLLGKVQSESVGFNYTLEYASQSEGSGATTNYSADYLLAEVGFNIQKVGLKLGYENIGVDNGMIFTTPLATVHAFNGWADRTLPLKGAGSGIKDTYFSISGKVKMVKLMAVYHSLDANTGNTDYGSEIDLLAVYKSSYGVVYGAKAAMFDAETANDDTTKFWLWSQLKF